MREICQYFLNNEVRTIELDPGDNFSHENVTCEQVYQVSKGSSVWRDCRQHFRVWPCCSKYCYLRKINLLDNGKDKALFVIYGTYLVIQKSNTSISEEKFLHAQKTTIGQANYGGDNNRVYCLSTWCLPFRRKQQRCKHPQSRT